MKQFNSLFAFCLALLASDLAAQIGVTGQVVDTDASPLIAVSVLEKGTTNEVLTDFTGNYAIEVASEDAILVFSYVGCKTQEIKVNGETSIPVTLEEGITIGEIQVVGSRSYNRSSTSSPVAVDVIDMTDIPTRSGQVEVTQILQYLAPSFNASKQSGSDGADHIVPAALRGLGPDQTLVLVNGKRRHQSSLINVYGTRGRGNTGTDLNTIPVAAIKRIEILRDGAAAQYGSDAIAGVINIVLNDDADQLKGSVTYGTYSTNSPDELAGTANADGKNRLYDKDRALDGNTVRVDANYGISLGKDGGFINFTTEFLSKQRTLRPGADFRKGYGEAGIGWFNFMANAAMPLGKNTELYAFGGNSFRYTDAYAFTRNGGERVVAAIFPDGYTPRITSSINDASASVGIRHQFPNNWKLDFNNTYGKNKFHYFLKNTLNASLVENSPTEFDAGGHSLSQNTTGFTLSKLFQKQHINVAFGAEHRLENFQIFAGDEAAYATYDVNGQVITSPSQEAPYDSLSEAYRPGGSQGFPGYSPRNAVNRFRNNVGAFLDVEWEPTKALLIAAAVRAERYSDFGNTLNYKLAARYNIHKTFAVRGAFSTGFRAPSLAQIYYNLRFTNFVGGQAEEVLLAPNNSAITRAYGIQPLRQENAMNGSFGFAFQHKGFSATIDGYYIAIQNRIVLTEYFDASALGLNVASAQFFANGIDTRTLGLDVVLSYIKYFGDNRLAVSLAANFNKMEIPTVHNGDLDRNTFFGPREEYFVRASAPAHKIAFQASYRMRKFEVAAALTRFSQIILLDWQMYEDDADYGSYEQKIEAAKDIYKGRFVTDFTFTYNPTANISLSLGANNLLNIYPTVQDDWTDSGGYWDAVQMGTSGAYYYLRAGVKF